MYDEGSTKEGRTKEEGPGTETLLLEGGSLRPFVAPFPDPSPRFDRVFFFNYSAIIPKAENVLRCESLRTPEGQVVFNSLSK